MSNQHESLTKVSSRIRYLDGWRGISIYTVLAGHFLLRDNSYISFGPLGVELFFVLSGRLMAEILFIENYELKAFFVRRFSRIYPALLFFIVSMLIAGLIVGSGFRFKPILALYALSFTYNYVAAFGEHTGAFDHIWSLCIEEHAYILLGVLAFFHRRVKLPSVIIIAIIAFLSTLDGLISSYYFGQDWTTAYWRTDSHIASILDSSFVYLATREGGLLSCLRSKPIIPLCSFILAVYFCSEQFPFPIHYSIGTMLLSISVNTVDDLYDFGRKQLSKIYLTSAGILSYSVYLWQQPFFKFSSDKNIAVSLICLLIGVFCGLVSFYLVEQPFRRNINKFYRIMTSINKHRNAGLLDDSAISKT